MHAERIAQKGSCVVVLVQSAGVLVVLRAFTVVEVATEECKRVHNDK